MKILVSVFASLVLSSVCFGHGKIQFEPQYNAETQQWKTVVGLSVYEAIVKDKFAYTSWTGLGETPYVFQEDVTWYVSKHRVEMYVGNFTLGTGVKFSYIEPFGEYHTDVFGQVALRIW